MTKIYITGQDGSEYVLDAPEGTTVMEVIRDGGLNLPSICGGGCDCATCHIIVSPEWFAKLEEAGEFEVALVEDAPGYEKGRSRLACQIDISDALDGFHAELPQDFF